jgi:hypothetical protein
MTFCVDHSGCVLHYSLSDARAWAPHPEDWCPYCQETRDNGGVPDGPTWRAERQAHVVS